MSLARTAGGLVVGCVAAIVLGFALAAAGWAGEGPAPKAEGAKAEGAKAEAARYSGTFTDTEGHKGPLLCKITPGAAGAYTLNFTGTNQGTAGPKMTREFTFDLTGKKEGDTLTLSGNPTVGRMGAYELSMAVGAKTVEGKFKKATGKDSGTFSLTPAPATP